MTDPQYPNPEQYPQYTPAVTPPPARRSIVPTLLIGSLIVVLLVGVGAFFLLNQKSANGPTPPSGPSHATLLPKETLSYISYNSRATADTTANLDRIQAAFESQPKWKALSDKAKQDYQNSLNDDLKKCKDAAIVRLAYDTDLLWRENVTYAFVPPSADKLKTLDMKGDCFGYQLARVGVVFIVDTTIVPEDSTTLVGQLVSKTQGNVALDKVEDYAGQPIYKLSLADSDFLVAMRDKNAIVTLDSDLMHRTLDAGKDATATLDQDADYQTTVSKLPNERIFTVYINVSKVSEFSKQLSSANTANTDSYVPYLGMADVSGLLGLSMVAQDTGIQVDVASALKSSYLNFNYKVPTLDNRSLLDKAPTDVLAMVGSQDIKGLVNAAQSFSLTSLVLGSGSPNDFAEAKRKFKEETGLDMDEDVLSWMSGEWSAYAHAEGQNDKGEPNLQGAMVIKLNSDGDKAKAQNFVTKITDYARKQATQTAPTGDLKRTVIVDKQDIEGNKFNHVAQTTIYGVSSGYAHTNTDTLYYAVVGDAFVAASSPAAVSGYLKGGVSGAPIYQASLKHIDQKNGGVIYLDLNAIRLLYEQTLKDADSLKHYEDEVKPWIAPYKGVALSNTQPDDRFSIVRLNINIDKP